MINLAVVNVKKKSVNVRVHQHASTWESEKSGRGEWHSPVLT